MPPSRTEYLAHLAHLELGIREIVASYKTGLQQLIDQDSRTAIELRELIALNEGALAQLEASRASLTDISDRERDILDGVGPPPSYEELWGDKPA